MLAGERQVAPDVSGIRRDHVARYEWAAGRIRGGSCVVDVACGIGYGTRVLAEAGHSVLGLDRDREAIAYAREHYSHTRADFKRFDAAGLSLNHPLQPTDAAVCFETIEHIEDPLPLLRYLREAAPLLLASVPNEEVFPFHNHAFHFRHYTRTQFEQLLARAGWRVTEWLGQLGPTSYVEANMLAGRTLIAVAERGEVREPDLSEFDARAPEILTKPEHVTIVALGPSSHEYLELAKTLGARKKLGDEVWAINALGDVIKCDRIFHMDDVRIQEIRAAARPDSNIAAMLEWLKQHPGPIYTSRPHPDYPGMVAYPLEDVITSTKQMYFNSTVAYAVAYAIHLGVKKISCYGMDFTYPNAHQAEKGRACVEFWLGIAANRGISIRIPKTSTLMDACEPTPRRFYGYDTVRVKVDASDGVTAKVAFEPLEELPTADEIEAAYDHNAHPNPLVTGK